MGVAGFVFVGVGGCIFVSLARDVVRDWCVFVGLYWNCLGGDPDMSVLGADFLIAVLKPDILASASASFSLFSTCWPLSSNWNRST